MIFDLTLMDVLNMCQFVLHYWNRDIYQSTSERYTIIIEVLKWMSEKSTFENKRSKVLFSYPFFGKRGEF